MSVLDSSDLLQELATEQKLSPISHQISSRCSEALNLAFFEIQIELSPVFLWKKVWGLDFQLKQDYKVYKTV